MVLSHLGMLNDVPTRDHRRNSHSSQPQQTWPANRLAQKSSLPRLSPREIRSTRESPSCQLVKVHQCPHFVPSINLLGGNWSSGNGYLRSHGFSDLTSARLLESRESFPPELRQQENETARKALATLRHPICKDTIEETIGYIHNAKISAAHTYLTGEILAVTRIPVYSGDILVGQFSDGRTTIPFYLQQELANIFWQLEPGTKVIFFGMLALSNSKGDVRLRVHEIFPERDSST